ncbi:c-type cytochrome [Duganella phyllosphaerae]|uniref:Cytochrome c2 n=1 Tax=Duganella phyllosphaerae TaxID=762836 RepID=A0A1E7WN89_9BURK|nr:c-type cytochrome [Duganella phyllosphaerae]OFA00618.1 cytochrome c2 precursor [Duganella phyllosphaerae]
MKKILLPLLLSALASAPAQAAGKIGNARAGEAAFLKCASCHQVGKYAQPAYGPQLNAIVGRKAGTSAGYKYSEAMKRSGLVWTEANLAAFLRAPHDVVPGTSMRFWGIGDEQQVADLLAYMRGLR